MRLKRLRLSGFKSFCDDTELSFGDNGVNVVVGPNGCGKSNVVDAIRWALGEQGPRQLRGQSMSDVIFNGSTSRKPIGRCEVSLTFDNTKGLFLERYKEYSEIQVTRRLYRDGESEYLINGMPSRLLDIRELVMDTGIAGKAYAIVEQGRVEQFITATPQERRLFVEEAAGIVRYRTRRIAAERKLEQTDQNLLRVNDLLSELRRQESALGAQVEKAKEYLALRDEVSALGAELARARLRKSEREVARLEEEYRVSGAQRDGQESALALHQAQWERLQNDQATLELQLREARATFFDGQRQAQQIESELALERQNHRHTGEWIADLEMRLLDVRKRLETAAAQQEQAGRDLEALTREETAFNEAIAHDESGYTLKDGAARAIEDQQQALRERQIECHTQLTGISSQQRHVAERIEEWMRRDDQLDKAVRVTTEELGAARARLTALEARHAAVHAELAGLERDGTEVAGSLTGRGQARDALLRELEQAECGEREERARLEALAEIDAAYEGLDESVRGLLQWADGQPGGREALGLLGPLADFVRVEPEVLDWAEPFLAPYLDLLVVREAASIPALEAAVAGQGAGRVRMVPLDALPARPMAATGAGTAFAEQVAVHPGMEPLREVLFAAARVLPPGTEPYPLPELAAGCAQWLEGAGRYQLDHNGVIALGKSAAPAAAILRRRTEMEAMRERLLANQARVGELRERRDVLTAEIETLLERQRALVGAQQEQGLQLKSLEQERAHEEREAGRVAKALEHVEGERRQVGADLENARGQQAEHARKTEEWTRHREEAEAALAAMRERVETARAEAALIGQRLTDAKIGLSRVASRLEHLREQIAALGAERDQLIVRAEEETAELERQRAERERLSQAISSGTTRLAALQQRQQTDQAEVNRLAQEYEEGERQRVTLLGPIKAAQQARDQAQARLHALETQLAVERTRLEQAAGQLGEAPPPHPEFSQLDESELESRAKRGQARLDRMAGVNLAAPEEHAALVERVAFLETQRADLERAVEDLKESIRRMNTESRKRFKETFDQVNETFQRVFPEVFGGGEARLVLTDSEDLLLAGVDIVAQPPGKKLQNLTLLSGGEKALTAIALIFSFFLIKPSPFCLLDEVDAPLDDANVGRFNRLVQSMTEHTQFIIITHNRRTMESGHQLFGVTMEEAGVSKVVSVNLADRPS